MTDAAGAADAGGAGGAADTTGAAGAGVGAGATAARRLAAVCSHIAEMGADLRNGPAGDEGPLERLLAAVRDGRDVSAPMAVLHAALQAGGDPLGLDGYAPGGGSARGLRLTGVADRPAEPVYLCPAGRCDRYWWPRGPVPVPHCAIDGAELRAERL